MRLLAQLNYGIHVRIVVERREQLLHPSGTEGLCEKERRTSPQPSIRKRVPLSKEAVREAEVREKTVPKPQSV